MATQKPAKRFIDKAKDKILSFKRSLRKKIRNLFFRFRSFCKKQYSKTAHILHKLHSGEEMVSRIVASLFLAYLVLSYINAWSSFKKSMDHSNFFSYICDHIIEEALHDPLHFTLSLLHVFTLLYCSLFVIHVLLAWIGDPNKWYGKVDPSKLSGFITEFPKQTSEFNAGNLDELTVLGVEAFGETNLKKQERKELYEAWFNANQDVFQLIYNEQNEPVGYLSILPLKESSYNKYIDGKLNQFGFDKNDIASGKSNYLYINAVYLKEIYQDNEEYHGKLMSGIMYKIASLVTDINAYYLSAEAFTRHGEKILNRLGFNQKNRRHFQRYPTYILTRTENGLKFSAGIKEAHDILFKASQAK